MLNQSDYRLESHDKGHTHLQSIKVRAVVADVLGMAVGALSDLEEFGCFHYWEELRKCRCCHGTLFSCPVLQLAHIVSECVCVRVCVCVCVHGESETSVLLAIKEN